MKDDQYDELSELTASYLDGTLNEEQRAQFERLLRDDSHAVTRVADAVRFDVELRDAMNPDHIELIEQRRMVIDRATGKPVLVETSQRVAQRGEWSGAQEAPAQKKRYGWLLLVFLVAIAGAVTLLLTRKKESLPVTGAQSLEWLVLPVRNAGFEQKVMTAGGAVDYSALPNWQDKFSTPNALLTNQDAHAGVLAARLRPGGHIKQLLDRAEGIPLNFEPGMKVKVSGWLKLVKPGVTKSNTLRADLHFVDEQKRQYAVNYDLMAFAGGDWQPFTVEFTIPDQAKFVPAWYGDQTKDEAQSVQGRQVLLSLYNDTVAKSFATDVLIDDVKVEWLPASSRK